MRTLIKRLHGLLFFCLACVTTKAEDHHPYRALYSSSSHHESGHRNGSLHHDTHSAHDDVRSRRAIGLPSPQKPSPQKQQQHRRNSSIVATVVRQRTREVDEVPVEDRKYAKAFRMTEAGLCESSEDLFGELFDEENCSSVAVLWYNKSDDGLPVVTNETITAKVRLPGVAVMGLRFRRPSLLVTIVGYALVNMVTTSVCPLPIATSLVPLSTVLFGFLAGMIINVTSTCAGAYCGLLLVRYACRPRFVRALGKYQSKWAALDRMVAAEGWQISLLIRCSPASPLVITNTLLALTSISQLSFLWTVLVGEIVTSFPFAYATYVGEQLVDGQKSPMLLVSSFIGLGASIAVTWKVSLLAKSVLEERETYSSLALGAVPLEQGKEGSESSFYES